MNAPSRIKQDYTGQGVFTPPVDVTQLRHELHRAVDFGTEVDRAAWVAKYGDALLTEIEELRQDLEAAGRRAWRCC